MMIELEIIIGIVKDGKFYTRSPEPEISAPTLLTKIKVMESVPPESRQLILTEYEGKAIAVQGHNQGSVIYQAAIIDVAGPIVTFLVKYALGD
ncbi:MAG: hypothetical protein ACW98D_17140 [Promethearchaeota archaeon]|jgi:hypothetical protein